MKRPFSLGARSHVIALSIILLSAWASVANAQAVEDGFDPGANGAVLAIAVQADGKILVGGDFTTLGGSGFGTTTRNYLGRLNIDGSLDTTFNPGANGRVHVITVQADGKILIGGRFTMVGGGETGTTPRNYIARLNPDGSLDPSFDPGASSYVYSFVAQPDGKILVGGAFGSMGGGTGTTQRQHIARLNANGSLDVSFNPGANADVFAMTVQEDEKIIVVGAFTRLGGGGTGTTVRNRIGRLNPDGSLDAGFNPGANDQLHAVTVQPDGKILAVGRFTFLGGGGLGVTTRNRIARINADGSLDASFDPGADSDIYALTVQPDGKILVGGSFSTLAASPRLRMGRLNADGSLDTSFDPEANGELRAMVVQADGKILVGGWTTTLGSGIGSDPMVRNYIGRIYADGSVDATFSPEPSGGGGVRYSFAIQPDGKVLAGGGGHLKRFSPDGLEDNGIYWLVAQAVMTIAAQENGQVVVGGAFETIGGVTRERIARFHSSAVVDAGFDPGADAAVNALSLQTSGHILMAGNFTRLGGGGMGTIARNHIGRVAPSGELDGDFNPGANGGVTAVAEQPDGKILVGGNFTRLGGGTGTTPRNHIGRINPDGSLDFSFDPGANAAVLAMVVQPDGRILVVGNFTTLGGGGTGTTARSYIARLNGDGSLDTSFNPGANGRVESIALQTDGKILVVGQFQMLGGGGTGTTERKYIARLNPDGSLDTSFDSGANSEVLAVALQPDGKILVGGYFSGLGGAIGTTTRYNIGRIATLDSALQSLDVTDAGGTVTWTRSGASPEVQRVTFESSTDGVTYWPLGNGSRVIGGWQLTEVSLPTNQNVYVRARGHYSTGQFNGSHSVVESIRTVFVPGVPVITMQPLNQTVSPFTTATFTAAASGAPTYRWQVSINGGLTWTNLTDTAPYSGVMTATLSVTVTTGGLSGALYRVVATNGAGSATSNAATLTVLSGPPAPELAQNGSFSGGLANWTVWEEPDIVHNHGAGGIFQFYKANPTSTASRQAVIFQNTGQPMAAGTPLVVRFDLGNSSDVRKRISVLVLDSDFSDLTVCAFWLAPHSPLRAYQMRTHTRKPWVNAAIYFYAATAGSEGGFYLLDNVSIKHDPEQSAERTDCVDPTAPVPIGGSDSANLLANGDFGTGLLSPWGLFGQITQQIVSGVFEFYRPPGTPAGVVMQNTGQAMTAGQILTATFQLGNSSSVRKRVTVILHDSDFSDLSACTFWLQPGQPLSDYTHRTFATKAWANATLSVYPATVGTDEWIRLDNVTLRRTPSTAVLGTECIEPAAAAPTSARAVTPTIGGLTSSVTAATSGLRPTDVSTLYTESSNWRATTGFAPSGSADSVGFGWAALASDSRQELLTWLRPIDLSDATDARLRFRSWLASRASTASVQVSTDGSSWQTLAAVSATDNWELIEVDLSGFTGQVVWVRFVFEAVAPVVAEDQADIWRVEDIEVVIRALATVR